MYNDSYKKLEAGFISLSGKCFGADGVACEKLANLTGGNAVVEFKPIDEYAKKLVSEKLGQNYVENNEGYIVEVADNITVFADSDRAKLYAACSIMDKYKGKIQKGIWWNYPACEHRSIRIFLPPKSELDYFYKLIDTIVHLGYNAILLEICGALEFKRHPEVNQGWIDYCASVNETLEKMNYVGKAYYRTKNSIHTCNAGGAVYSHEEMKDIVDYCRERCVEIVPEVPSLSHSEYFLVSHPELRECMDEPFAATCCPSNPDLYKLVFDFYDEVIEVFNPKAIHIGHDEWWNMCVCDKCKDKNPAELYAEDVLKSYNYLKSRGVDTYMWGDKLCRVMDQTGEVHGGAEKHLYSVPTQGKVKTVEIMGKEYPLYDMHWFNAPDWVKEQGHHQIIRDTADCADLLPADITYCNWYYSIEPRLNDVFLKSGKNMIYGNCGPSRLFGYKKRFELGAKGFSVSSWSETSEYCTQLWGTIFEMGYGSVIAWSHSRTEFDHIENMYDTFEALYNIWNHKTLNSRHIEVTHSIVKDWDEGRKYYGQMARVDTDFLTLGNYHITYKDGTEKIFPVMFVLNCGLNTSRLERCMSTYSWSYTLDRDIAYSASACKISKDENGMWYTTVIPVTGEVEKCEYVAKSGFEDYVKVKSIEIK